jgi:cysteine-rich repeat protein
MGSLVVGAACDDGIARIPEGSTSVLLTIKFEGTLNLDQLVVTGTSSDGSQAFKPLNLPEVPTPLPTGEEQVSLVWPAETDSFTVKIRVDGKSGDAIVASEEKNVDVQKGKMSRSTFTLGDPAVCGDGLMRTGIEKCDDGNLDDGDGCSALCEEEEGFACETVDGTSVCRSGCGDGRVNSADEVCDDANVIPGDGCDGACQVEAGWECDAPADDASTCSPICGDGNVLAGENCDDGNTLDDDGCSANCTVEAGYTCQDDGGASTCTTTCGDGLIRGTEICDDGNGDDADGCSAACAVETDYACAGEPSVCARCGDGLITGSETCDDGNANVGDGCDDACQVEMGYLCADQPSLCVTICGDGLQAGTEACDDGRHCEDGTECSDTATCAGIGDGECKTRNNDGCDTICRLEGCGDGLLAGSEGCDDANMDSDDGCSNACQVEPGWSCSGLPSTCTTICGDGVIAGSETCDDDNTTDDGNGCDATCQRNDVCGDGTVQALFETCDDANTTDDGNGCDATCQRNDVCGDGTVQDLFEGCDDTNTTDDGNGCDATCQRNDVCGDSTIQDLFENCDDGNATDDGNGCDATCQRNDVCGDGNVQALYEDCDDNNTVDNNNGCSADCQQNNTCGDGNLEDQFEDCDDNNTTDDGNGCSATCTDISVCGDGVVQDLFENCEASADDGKTCWEMGMVAGGGNGTYTCANDCSGPNPLGCDGGLIDNETQVATAVGEVEAVIKAEAQRMVIRVQPGTMTMTQTITVDEGGPQPFYGITLEPLNGAGTVIFDGTANPMFSLASENIEMRDFEFQGAGGRAISAPGDTVLLEGLDFSGAFNPAVELLGVDGQVLNSSFTDVSTGVHIPAGGTSPGNHTVDHNLFVNTNQAPLSLISVETAGNTISANRLEHNEGTINNAVGVSATSEDITIAMNVIYGPFKYGIRVDDNGNTGTITAIDHNSIHQPTDNSGGGGDEAAIRVRNINILCMRNNAVKSHANNIALEISGGAIVGDNAACTDAGVGSGENSMVGPTDVCNGTNGGNTDCSNECDGGGPLCDLSDDPAWVDAELCLPSGNALINSGSDLGYDLFDGDAATHVGPFPDVGARESGTSRSYGAILSTCPAP